jgi:peptidoglycan/LPS O-acetylase OafA/YrhL
VVGLPLFAFCIAGLLSYVIRHANSKRPICRLLRSKPLVTLGMVSYMLYLLHVPVYFLVTQLAVRVGVTAGRYEGALTIGIASAAVSICLSLLSFRYFETPILSYKDRLTGSLLNAANTKGTIEAGVTRSH